MVKVCPAHGDMTLCDNNACVKHCQLQAYIAAEHARAEEDKMRNRLRKYLSHLIRKQINALLEKLDF